jgi:chromosome partitioning protein
MQVVSVIAQKGGVGKTTTAMSLAAICSEASRTLLVDVDPQGSASWWAENAGERLPFDFTAEADPAVLATLRTAAVDRWDVVIVDTPGSLEGRDVLSTVLASSDYVVIPTEPAYLAVAPLIRTVQDLIVPSDVPYRVLLNKVDGRALGMRDDAFAMLDAQGIAHFRASCRELSAHAYAPGSGAVVTQYARDRYSIEAASEYRAVALEMFADWQVSIGRHTRLAVAARSGDEKEHR